LAVPGDDGLQFVGKVGTGFGDRELGTLTARLERLEQASSPLSVPADVSLPGVRWVRASLVGKVEFTEWTASGRLRHPFWRGWRPHKDPGDIVRAE
jgi:bifunctional non-homologous end joining protein LigD